MDRRAFLKLSAGAAIWGGPLASGGPQAGSTQHLAPLHWAAAPRVPAYSLIPVVGDGKWIWTEPPKTQRGYLEPRPYRMKVGIELQGRGTTGQILATTTVPVACLEQKIEEEWIEADGCQARFRQLGPHGRQLLLAAPRLLKGQVISAVAHFKLTVYKQYHAYQRDQFPAEQTIPADIRKQYLGDSPGIQTRSEPVRRLHRVLSEELSHPWDLAKRFAAWIPKNIRGQMGKYTSVVNALENRRGDCEEMAAALVALCRAAGIPARLVWIPNHNWAEFYLVDREGRGHWIPAHTACYFWFGWTGAHEVVLQKGDRIRVPERGKLFRLLADWMQWAGTRPKVRYPAELTPEAASPQQDAGPGARRKLDSGEWKVVGTHPLDKYIRR